MYQFQTVGHLKCTVKRCIQNLLEAKRGGGGEAIKPGTERNGTEPEVIDAQYHRLYSSTIYDNTDVDAGYAMC